jgi:tetratricopeptide (TPR) repeat protein
MVNFVSPIAHPSYTGLMRGLSGLILCALLSGCTSPKTATGSGLPTPDFDKIPAASRGLVRSAWDAASKSPENSDSTARLGMLLLTFDQPASAAAAFERASANQPENFSWIYYLGIAQLAAARAAEALPTLRKALKIHSNFVPLQLKLTEALFASGKLQEAQQACRVILSDHPDAAPAHKILAAIYQQSGSADLAAQESALAVMPKTQPDYLKDPWMSAVAPPKAEELASPKNDGRAIHFARGRELMGRKQFKQAIAELQQTLTPEDGETPGYLYSLSVSYSLAGDIPSATKTGEQAKAMAVKQGKTQLAEAIDGHLKRLQPPSEPQLPDRQPR